MKDVFTEFAAMIVERNRDHLLDYGPDEQVELAVNRLTRFNATTPLTPVPGMVVDLAGFGRASVHFRSEDDYYLLLSEVAAAVGMPVWEACRWARKSWLFDLEEQRYQDEEGDGTLGHECLRGYVEIGVSFVAEDPEARPDGGGRRMSDYGDWLIARNNLVLFLMDSPWGEEFMSNMRGLSEVSALRVWSDVFDPDLVASGPLEADALRRARQGPALSSLLR